MVGSRVRRPLTWQILSLLLLLLPLSWACDMPQSHPSAAGSGSSANEAERTRKIEAKAAEIKRKEEEIRNMQGTDQDKIDAVTKLEADRRELTEMQESGK